MGFGPIQIAARRTHSAPADKRLWPGRYGTGNVLRNGARPTSPKREPAHQRSSQRTEIAKALPEIRYVQATRTVLPGRSYSQSTCSCSPIASDLDRPSAPQRNLFALVGLLIRGRRAAARSVPPAGRRRSDAEVVETCRSPVSSRRPRGNLLPS